MVRFFRIKRFFLPRFLIFFSLSKQCDLRNAHWPRPSTLSTIMSPLIQTAGGNAEDGDYAKGVPEFVMR